MMSKLRLIFLIILTPIFFFSCKQNSPIPEVYVNFYLELNNPVFTPLNTIGGYIVIQDEGYKGIIICRTNFDQFAVYDAACTYDPHDTWGRVVPESNGLFAKDTVCGSKFDLYYGYAQNGPATIPLKLYMAEYNPNTNTLFIHN